MPEKPDYETAEAANQAVRRRRHSLRYVWPATNIDHGLAGSRLAKARPACSERSPANTPGRVAEMTRTALEPREAVVACIHVMRQGDPIDAILRSAPAHPDDSGWTFCCHRDAHEVSEWLIVAAEEVIRRSAEVASLLDDAEFVLPEGYWAYRGDAPGDWLISPQHLDPLSIDRTKASLSGSGRG